MSDLDQLLAGIDWPLHVPAGRVDWRHAHAEGQNRLAASDYKNALIQFGLALQAYPRASSAMEDLAELATVVNRRGLARMHSENFDPAEADFRSARSLREWLCANKTCPIEKVAGVIANLGNLRVHQERFNDSLVFFKEALQLMDAAGENEEAKRNAMKIHHALAVNMQNCEEHTESDKILLHLGAALKFAEELRDEEFEATILHETAAALNRMLDRKEASGKLNDTFLENTCSQIESHHLRILGLPSVIQSEKDTARVAYFRAKNDLRRGRAEVALEHALKCAAYHTSPASNALCAIEIREWLSRILWALGRSAEAAEEIRAAVKNFEEVEAPEEHKAKIFFSLHDKYVACLMASGQLSEAWSLIARRMAEGNSEQE